MCSPGSFDPDYPETTSLREDQVHALKMADSKREESKMSSAPGSADTNGIGGRRSLLRERVALQEDSKPSADGVVVTASIANAHSTYVLVSEGPEEGDFTFTLSWDGLTRDQAALIGIALGMTGPEVGNHLENALTTGRPGWVVLYSSRLSAPVVRLSTAPSMPRRGN